MADSMKEIVEKLYKPRFATNTLPEGRFHRVKKRFREIKNFLNEHSFVKVGILMLGLMIVWQLIAVYNKITCLKTDCESAYAEVGNELKRRSNLYPKLAVLLEGYTSHESENFKYVSDSHKALIESKLKTLKEGNENEFTAALSSLLALVESFPELKANQPIQDIINGCIATENRISEKKSKFNMSANKYNQMVLALPQKWLCMIYGFPGSIDYMSAQEEALRSPEMLGLRRGTK